MEILEDNDETLRQILMLSDGNSQRIDKKNNNEVNEANSKRSFMLNQINIYSSKKQKSQQNIKYQVISQKRHSLLDNLDKHAQDQYQKKKESFDSYSFAAQIYFATQVIFSVLWCLIGSLLLKAPIDCIVSSIFLLIQAIIVLISMQNYLINEKLFAKKLRIVHTCIQISFVICALEIYHIFCALVGLPLYAQFLYDIGYINSDQNIMDSHEKSNNYHQNHFTALQVSMTYIFAFIGACLSISSSVIIYKLLQKSHKIQKYAQAIRLFEIQIQNPPIIDSQQQLVYKEKENVDINEIAEILKNDEQQIQENHNFDIEIDDEKIDQKQESKSKFSQPDQNSSKEQLIDQDQN